MSTVKTIVEFPDIITLRFLFLVQLWVRVLCFIVYFVFYFNYFLVCFRIYILYILYFDFFDNLVFLSFFAFSLLLCYWFDLILSCCYGCEFFNLYYILYYRLREILYLFLLYRPIVLVLNYPPHSGRRYLKSAYFF